MSSGDVSFEGPSARDIFRRDNAGPGWFDETGREGPGKGLEKWGENSSDVKESVGFLMKEAKRLREGSSFGYLSPTSGEARVWGLVGFDSKLDLRQSWDEYVKSLGSSAVTEGYRVEQHFFMVDNGEFPVTVPGGWVVVPEHPDPRAGLDKLRVGTLANGFGEWIKSHPVVEVKK